MAGRVTRTLKRFHSDADNAGGMKSARIKSILRGFPVHHSRLISACYAFLGVIAFGTIGFTWIEGWGVWQSLFFTMITITTVGYGSEGLSKSGELFTAVLLIGGIATTTYAFSVIVESAADRKLAWRRKMQNRINALSRHYIVCGHGRIGRAISARLLEADYPFVVVDSDPRRVEMARDHGMLTVEGDATEDATLIQAGVDRASGLVSVVKSDARNIVITLSARELSPDLRIITRAENTHSTHKIRRAGAEEVVCPYQAGGSEIADKILRPRLAEFLRRSDDENERIELGEVTIEEGSFLVGRTIQDYGSREGSDIVFVAIKRGDHVKVQPRGDERFKVGDILIVACRPAKIAFILNDTRPENATRQDRLVRTA